MNQVIDRMIKVSLVIMVLLSLFLSWKIWTKPGNRSLTNKEKDNGSEVIQTKKMTDVFVPTKLFYHPEEGDFLYSNRETMILDMAMKVATFEYKHGKAVDETDIQEVLYKSDSFTLFFPEELPISFYEDINELSLTTPSKMKDFKFSRIIFSLAENKVYFVNPQMMEGISYNVEGDSRSVRTLLKDEEKNNYLKVSLTPEHVANIYYLEDEVKLKTYSYILATQSFTTFTKAFFNQQNDLYSNEGENVNLTNGEGESLTIQTDTGEVNYFGKLKSTKNTSVNSLYYETFQYVENLGNTLGNLRYFDTKGSDVIYRNYIEGFPVFGNDMKGLLEVSVQNKNVFVGTNQETIQIPIPSTQTVTLVRTEELMAELVAAGADMSQLADAQIAYEWQPNAETKQAIDLVPTWYLKYSDTWYPSEELMSQLEKGGI